MIAGMNGLAPELRPPADHQSLSAAPPALTFTGGPCSVRDHHNTLAAKIVALLLFSPAAASTTASDAEIAPSAAQIQRWGRGHPSGWSAQLPYAIDRVGETNSGGGDTPENSQDRRPILPAHTPNRWSPHVGADETDRGAANGWCA